MYSGIHDGRAWIWDIATTPEGRPTIAFTRHPTEEDHRYLVARWDGKTWFNTEICPAGKWFPLTPSGTKEREPHYSGGMALDHANPDTLYTARRIEGVFEIEKWQSSDVGKTWTARPVTAQSDHDNIRPFVVRHASSDGPALLWLSGEHYVHYTDYFTTIKAAAT